MTRETDRTEQPPTDKEGAESPATGTPALPAGPVRVAGRKAMQMPPKRWDKVDEEGDASFPASDPPGNY
jgi:hypothetical protein